MNWKPQIQKLTDWRPKNEQRTDEERWRTTKNLHGNISEALWKHLGLDFLHGIMFFHSNHLKYTTWRSGINFTQPPSPIYCQNRKEVATQLAQASLGFLSKFPDATPKLLSSPPPFNILWKSYGSMLNLVFFFFFASLSPILSEICLLRVSKMLRKPPEPFFNKWGEVFAAQLA